MRNSGIVEHQPQPVGRLGVVRVFLKMEGEFVLVNVVDGFGITKTFNLNFRLFIGHFAF